MSLRQRGLGMLVVVLLVLTVAAFAVIVAASHSGGDVHGSDANADGLQALFLAESGVERALKRFATGTACASLGDNPATGPVEATHTVTDLSTIGLGLTGYSITFSNGLATDFAGAALPATQCRVPVTGTVLGRNVSRTVHAIVDRNLFGAVTGTFNPTFNNPTTPGAPSNWTLNPATSFANTGGPDGTAPNCSRSIWHVKRQNANVAAVAEVNTPVNFTYTGGTNTTITFYWRALDRTGGGCVGGAASGPAWGGGCAGVANETQTCFRFTGSSTSVATFSADATAGVAVACPDVAGASAFAACSTNYAPAYPTKQTLNMAMAGAGTRTATNFFIHIRLQQNGRREIFLDHIEATNTTAIGAAHVRAWRDCSTAANPVTCI